MITRREILDKHKSKRGKISINSKVKINNSRDLAIVYTPGVAQVCLEIHKDKKKSYDFTSRANMVGIITDGTAVLGLGDIGPEAATPVMEGKSILFKELAGIDAFPISLDTKDTDKIIDTIKYLQPNFAAINLEDISAPRCFEIEQRLQKELDIPVFHDDQHGTAIVALAALINSAKLLNKKIKNLKVVVSGAGAAGIAITKLFYKYGIKEILVIDSKGIVSKDRKDLNIYKKEILIANKKNITGGLAEAIVGADVFVGVSKGGVLKKQMVTKMNKDSIVFAMSNPTPEIMPELAKKAGAKIIGTGRSDFPNQINNALVFPGFFKGILLGKHKQVVDGMKIVAAEALAKSIKKPTKNKIVPNVLDKKVVLAIAKAVAKYKVR
ncbi:NADP-dependent malic enzyme [Candidatus Parcubacteria bacterium]|jgi:malate dehydrogenase (oxaloacetate-decarboxylating)|nr:NADP-dependent malic enzyme [Candidatus Parcubacteria bacterium]MBT7228163.1 NADP-dependent malic enzyme [Candidatus Parcubacteria bacterium]